MVEPAGRKSMLEKGQSMFGRFIAALTVVLLIAGLAAGQDDKKPATKSYILDYSSGSQKTTDCEVKLDTAVPNGQDKNRSIVFVAPGTSKVTLKMEVPAKPSQVVLELEHLSSGAKVKHGGESVISIVINGDTAIAKWDVGTGSMAKDRVNVGKFFEEGSNTVELRFVAGATCYWLRRMELSCTFPPGTVLGGKVERIPADGKSDYAVLVRKATYDDADWKKVVDALVKKHKAVVIVYPNNASEAKDELAKVFPKYACFVRQPTRAGRRFVVAVHRLTRQLDKDPYTDVIWGILTGYEAADALRIAQEKKPLTIKRAAAGCGLDLKSFKEGAWYSETKQGVMWERLKGKAPKEKTCPPDTTESLVNELNNNKPSLFVTSGHATERDWQIGYSYKNGQFRCEKGQLYGLDTGNKRFNINSPNPKVYSPCGNCLMGHINGREAMALAWMHTGGVRQMTGYVVSTWFGYMGHGVNTYFITLQGQHTFAESFYFNNQALLARLKSEFPGSLEKNIDTFNIETDKGLMSRLASELKVKSKDELGLLWDRDTVAFYGDPAWEARVVKAREPDYYTRLTYRRIKDDRLQFEFAVTPKRDGKFARPPAALLPFRVKDIEVDSDSKPVPVITDNFILLPTNAEYKKNKRIRIKFTARRIK
jgi:zinc protease